ncbi:MAG: endo-1,4-beta-xylanase [Alphaproteobacteria bacterium]|nr:endo-1,4-beta-xylanase [Alphaproteobacteria bacterium]
MTEAPAISRRSLLLGAAAIAACPPSRAAEPASLRALAAASGLTFGSYLDMDDLRAQPDYAALAAREAGLMVSARMDWDHLQPAPALHELAGVDADFAWAQAHGMGFRGHALVWGERAPAWFAALPDRAAAVAALEDHVALTCRHFAGRMHSWDVVNEAILVGGGRADGLRPHVFLDKIGPDYLDIAFRVARDSDPATTLVYNEFGVEFAGTEQHAKRRVLLALLDGFNKRGTPIDAVGLQSHISVGEMARFEAAEFRGFLDEIAARGLEIMLTELDCVDKAAPADIAARDGAVADAYRRYLDAALAHPAVTTIVTWGLSDRSSWIVSGTEPEARRDDGQRPRPLPFDTGLKPKPAYRAIAEALRNAPGRGAIRRAAAAR